ncbi:MAG: hypothetical protein Q8J68_14675 [Methanolobus sp.]|uniref:hypothetical protein n=1 Tax=Methanolobus sp. TaxID=1874737 RepID=UPI0027317B2E|nr:hypothetical protein [Methanolobus sp.]MDP2218519.1 hypothetical protein [Methanolobus sp.]
MPNEFEVLTQKVDAGFERLGNKIEDLRQDFGNHKLPCLEKFADYEKRFAVIAAVNCAESKQEEKKRDWGKWFIRLILALIATGVVGLWFR